ncbi:Transcriptional regulator, IclR family [Dickeya dadantii 3937]|uniref:Transcriptional regulator, IclR family n=1 Tax=Dickeya dadantii (strain 3937) TaxID=198628 RepID=E0SM02_DICD3|nr:IclR family transcriptional regulator [Dickeya dadantii]ADM98160.1 Transcriptional regulator, IclR family [Dickeya dadantii 3937]
MIAKSRGGIQVISRAAAILREICESPDGLSLGQIASLTGLARSTVQRIVDALEGEHLVQAGAKGVRPGWGLRRLGEISNPEPSHNLRPLLYRLYERTKETVDLSTLDGTSVLFMDRFLSEQRIRAVPDIRVRYPAYTMANGKALLSTLSDREIHNLYGSGMLERITPNSVVNVDDLVKQLNAIRAGGFAYDREEHAVDSCAIGLPLRIWGGLNLAISVVVPTHRFHSHRSEIETALRLCVDECNQYLLKMDTPDE